MAKNNGNVLPHSSGGWKCDIKLLVGLVFTEGSEKDQVHAPPQFLVVTGSPWHSLTSRHRASTSVSSSHSIIPCVPVCKFPSFNKNTSQVGFRVYPNTV